MKVTFCCLRSFISASSSGVYGAPCRSDIVVCVGVDVGACIAVGVGVAVEMGTGDKVVVLIEVDEEDHWLRTVTWGMLQQLASTTLAILMRMGSCRRNNSTSAMLGDLDPCRGGVRVWKGTYGYIARRWKSGVTRYRRQDISSNPQSSSTIITRLLTLPR